jgi:hypothetical protein
MHARYYSSNLGRFLSVDPVGGKVGSSQSWNRYSYVWDNPIVLTDPTGESVYVITYTTGNAEGDDEFRRAAYTRAIGIRRSDSFDPDEDTVLVRGVEKKGDIQGVLDEASALDSQYGTIGEFTLFSHGGPRDGPTFQWGIAGSEHWFESSEVAGLNGNFSSGASAFFVGCNTAVRFAQRFADSQGISTYGYVGPANSFSSDPYVFRHPSDGDPVYLIQTPGLTNGGPLGMFMKHLGAGVASPMVRRDPRP